MPSTPSRRRLLAALGVAGTGLLGGCADSLSGPLSDSRDGGGTLQLRLRPMNVTLRDRYVLDLTETRPDWDEEAFAAALDGSATTYQGRAPFPRASHDPVYARHEGTYYRLDNVLVDEETTTKPVLRLYEVDDDPEAVAREDLPRVDQRAVQIAYMAARARGNPGGVPWDLVQRGGYVYPTEAAREESTLLSPSGPTHVSYRDAVYRVETTTETFHEPVYRPDVDAVADTDAGMDRVLDAQFVDSRLSSADLSAAERDVLREAEREGYSADHPYPEAANAVLRKLDQRAYVDGDVSNDALSTDRLVYVLKYDDRYYEYELSLETDR